MRIGNRSYTRKEVLERVGNIAQIGGTRHYVLNEGRSKGTSAVDVDTGSGFRFTVVPDRGMDISLASFRGTNLVYLTANLEAHPAYYDPYGLGWLRTWFAGLLTTCGLTTVGAPGKDGDVELGTHGRHSTNPAFRLQDNSRWEGDEYLIELTGVMDDAVLMSDKIRMTRTISTSIGSKSLRIRDMVENIGFEPCPFTILYHINPGFPLLDSSSEFMLTSREAFAYEEWADISAMGRFSDPIPHFREENFHHVMAADSEGRALAAMVNRGLDGGLGLFVEYDVSTLPFMNEWKMMGQGDYVVGMEPCNVPCENRAVLREKGILPLLEPGESREMMLEIGILSGLEEIAEFEDRVTSVLGDA